MKCAHVGVCLPSPHSCHSQKSGGCRGQKHEESQGILLPEIWHSILRIKRFFCAWKCTTTHLFMQLFCSVCKPSQGTWLIRLLNSGFPPPKLLWLNLFVSRREHLIGWFFLGQMSIPDSSSWDRGGRVMYCLNSHFPRKLKRESLRRRA